MKKKILFLVKLLFAAGILTWLIRRAGIDLREILSVPWFYPVLAMLCLFGQIVLTGVRWFFLLRAIGIRIPFIEAFSLTMQGVFFTLFIPAGSVGGDLVKAGILVKRTPDNKFNGAFSILADRLCGLIAMLFFTLLCCFLFFGQIRDFSPHLKFTVYTMMFACAGVLGCAICVFLYDYLYRIPVIKKLFTLLDKYSRGAFSRAAEATAVYRKEWKLVSLLIAGTTFICFPLLAGGVWFLGCGVLGKPLPLPGCLLASNLSQAVAALPLTNGGVGTRDFMCSEILKACGISAPDATLIPILYTVVFLIVSLSGSFFFIFDSFLCRRAKENACKKD